MYLCSVPFPEHQWIIFVHEQGNFWKATMKYPGIIVDYSTTQIQIHYEDVRRLPTEENNCSTRDQDECLNDYMTNALKPITNCKPHWMDLPLPICKDMTTLNASHQLVIESLHKMDSICKSSCDFLNIRTGARNFIKEKKYSKLYLYFPYKVPIEEENYLMNGLTLIAEIGGSAEIFLGICFYDLTQLLLWALKKKLFKSKQEQP